MIVQGESPLFSFNGKHCDDFDVTFLPSAYPLIPAQSIQQTSISGRHGTLRWKGRTFSPKRLKGKLYFLNTSGDDAPIPTDELLRRAMWRRGFAERTDAASSFWMRCRIGTSSQRSATKRR